MHAARLDVKVLHQSHACEERFAPNWLGEKLGDAAEGLEDTVLALQRIRGSGYATRNRELEMQVNRVPVFVNEPLQPPRQRLHTGSLDNDSGVLQLRYQSF